MRSCHPVILIKRKFDDNAATVIIIAVRVMIAMVVCVGVAVGVVVMVVLQ